jgi:hypothetical protein
VTAHLHLAPRSKTVRAIPPLPHTSECRFSTEPSLPLYKTGALFIHRNMFPAILMLNFDLMVETCNGSVYVRSLIFDKFVGMHTGAYRLKALHATIFHDQRRIDIVTYSPPARQRLGKHTPAGANARNRTSTARQRVSKEAFSTTKRLFSAWSVPRGYKATEVI